MRDILADAVEEPIDIDALLPLTRVAPPPPTARQHTEKTTTAPGTAEGSSLALGMLRGGEGS